MSNCVENKCLYEIFQKILLFKFPLSVGFDGTLMRASKRNDHDCHFILFFLLNKASDTL